MKTKRKPIDNRPVLINPEAYTMALMRRLYGPKYHMNAKRLDRLADIAEFLSSKYCPRRII